MSLLPALLCLAILAGVGHCGTGRRASYNNGPRHDGCRNPPPGVMKMARGIDITEFEPCPLEPVGTSGFRSPVVHMGCHRNRPWVTDGVEYNTPDEVWLMTTTPAGMAESDVRIYSTSQRLRKFKLGSVSLRGYARNYAFSQSSTYRKMQTLMLSQRGVYSEVEALDATKRVDLNPHWGLKLDIYAQDYLDRNIKNKDYRNALEEYQGFIDHFGTHYIASARLGGSIRATYQTNYTYFSARSEQAISDYAYSSFRGILRTYGRESESASETVDASGFLYASSEIIKYYGGEANLMTYYGIKQWQPTVDKNPWLLSVVVRPISELIRDGKQRENMEIAVKQYILWRYLEELRRLYDARSSSLPATVGDRLTALEDTPKEDIVEAEVKQLAYDIGA